MGGNGTFPKKSLESGRGGESKVGKKGGKKERGKKQKAERRRDGKQKNKQYAIFFIQTHEIVMGRGSGRDETGGVGQEGPRGLTTRETKDSRLRP